MAWLRLHALLASPDQEGGALGRPLRAGSYRAVAALSAVLDHDHRLVIQCMEAGCIVHGADRLDRELSDRTGLRPGVGRVGEAGTRGSRRRAEAPAVLGAWAPGKDRQG